MSTDFPHAITISQR
ncbi:hypothetical protein YPPY16_2381, partial [Yersinia pestis PY-16]